MSQHTECRYPRISEHYRQISDYYKIYDINSEDWFWRASHADDIEHFFGAEGASDYEVAVDAVKQLGFDTVFDIGCAHGFQSECFLNAGLKYIGIDDTADRKWNDDKFDYLIGKYPFTVPQEFLTGKYIAVSRLCVGILISEEYQFQQMAETFPDILICDNYWSSRLQKYYDLVSVFKKEEDGKRQDNWNWYYYRRK